MISILKKFIVLILASAFLFGCGSNLVYKTISLENDKANDINESIAAFELVNNGIPYFSKKDFLVPNGYEFYSNLDELGRCGVAFAKLSLDTMPQKNRGSIGKIKPSGWNFAKYDFIDGKYLYNRCHLIGYQLSAENSNEKNLVTGTRFLNTKGMLPFENKVASYIKRTGNQVLYRVTPRYYSSDLLAYGIQIEALSIEDQGEGIKFNVLCYNIQPGVNINYKNGDNTIERNNTSINKRVDKKLYIFSLKSREFHNPKCNNIVGKDDFYKLKCTRDDMVNRQFIPCNVCNP